MHLKPAVILFRLQCVNWGFLFNDWMFSLLLIRASRCKNSDPQTHGRWYYVMHFAHCGLGTPYGDNDPCQRCLKQSIFAWCHQAITRTNVDSSSHVLCCIYVWVISQGILMNLVITFFFSEITPLKWIPHLPGANWLIYPLTSSCRCILHCTI